MSSSSSNRSSSHSRSASEESGDDQEERERKRKEKLDTLLQGEGFPEAERRDKSTGLARGYQATMTFRRATSELMLPNDPIPLPAPMLNFQVWELVCEYINNVNPTASEKEFVHHRKSLFAFSQTCRLFRYLGERSVRWEGAALDCIISKYMNRIRTADQRLIHDAFIEALDCHDEERLRLLEKFMDPSVPIHSGKAETAIVASHRMLSAMCVRWLGNASVYCIRYVHKTDYFENMPNWQQSDDHSIVLAKGLKTGKEVEVPNYGELIPHSHADRCVKMLKTLQEIGWCDPKNEPVLFYGYYSIFDTNKEIARRFLRLALDWGACDINKGTSCNNYTALHQAAEYHDVEACDLLLSKGADAHVPLIRAFSDSHRVGTTPFDVAMQELLDHPSDETRKVAAVFAKYGHTK